MPEDLQPYTFYFRYNSSNYDRDKRRKSKIMQNNSHDKAGVVAPPPLIYLGMLIVGQILQSNFPLPFLPRSLRRWLGGLLIGAGAATITSAIRTMRNAGTNLSPEQPTTALVTKGPYQFTRNPIYLSMTLIYTGFSILTGAIWSILLLPVVMFIINRGVIDREERYLEQKFGDQYRSYKKHVQRWF
jgi:protein-S-isoprenylcysteine O-methyltransferase Ste14